MNLKAADQSFGYYVIATVEHSEIQKFLGQQSSKKFVYEDLEWLYQQFKKLEAKRS
jgi:hypothetical protein